jgi:hypothetical protein
LTRRKWEIVTCDKKIFANLHKLGLSSVTMLEHDHTQALQVAARLRDSVQKLHDMAHDVAAARQIKEFSSERRKNILAKYASTLSGPQGQREMLARTLDGYSTEFEELASQCLEAEKVIARWQAEQCRYEAARSLLSFTKGLGNDLMG